MDPMAALGDPVRRSIVEVLAHGSRPAGDLARAVGSEYGISQPAASRHLRVLREAGVVETRVDGHWRVYSLRRETWDDVASWVERVRSFWDPRLDALESELARPGHQRRPALAAPPDPSTREATT